MAMPSGDSPQKAQRVLPLPPGAPAETHGRVDDLARRLVLARLAVGLRGRARRRDPPLVGPAVPARHAADRHLSARQLGRLHDRARGPGDALLRRSSRSSSPASRRDRSSATWSGGSCSDGPQALPFVVVLVGCTRGRRPGEPTGTSLRLAPGAQGPRAGVPGLPALRRLRPRRGRRRVRVHCYTTWDTLEQLEAFLERGYTFERLLADLGGSTAERSLVMEKIF